MLYPSIAVMREIAGELAGRDDPADAAAPHFPGSAADDPGTAALIRRAHVALETAPERLGQDDVFMRAMAQLVARHAADPPATPESGREDRAVARVCDFIEAHLDADLTLADLAAVAGFSRYRLIRCFRRTLGATPHLYRTSRRVIRAKGLLADGWAPAEAGLACGFYDQAHFTRSFKRAVGVTPARYRAASLD